jgi:hypothetical protein
MPGHLPDHSQNFIYNNLNKSLKSLARPKSFELLTPRFVAREALNNHRGKSQQTVRVEHKKTETR